MSENNNNNKRKLVLPLNVAPINKRSTRGNPVKENNPFDIVDSFGDSSDFEDSNVPETETDSENAIHAEQTDDDIDQLQNSKTTKEEIFKIAAKYATEWISIYSKRLQKSHIPKCDEEKFATLLNNSKADLELKYNQKGNKYRVNYDKDEWNKLQPSTYKGNK